jgi:hypothetical protein
LLLFLFGKKKRRKKENFQEFSLQTMSDLKVEQENNQDVETGKHVKVVIEKKIIGE